MYANAARRARDADAVAPKGVKFNFWRAMLDLGRLVLRSGAPNLRLRIAAALALVFVGKLAGVWAPLMLGDAVNALAPSGGRLGRGFIAGALAFAGLSLAAACAPYARDVVFTRVSQSTMARAAVETFQHALSLSLDFHQSKQMGSLSRIIDRGSRSTDFLIRSVVFNIGPTAIELVLAVAVMAGRFDWRFALVALFSVLIYVVVTFKITDWRLSHRRALNDADSRTAGLAVDALINYETVKTFGADRRVVAAYAEAMDEYVDASVQANSSLNMLNAAQSVILNLALAVMTVMAGLAVIDGQMQIGQVVAAVLLLRQLYQPLGVLGFNYREIRQAFIDMEQMVDLTKVRPEISDAPDAQDLPPASGQGAAVAFDHVSFRHDARSQGLSDVTFAAQPGETIALVGPSGAGKTTAVRLAMRLIDPQEGRVLIDGVDMRRVKLEAVRRAVALVPQDVALFNDTLFRNIAFARPDAAPEAVRAAAEAAELGDFIDGLPNGMSTRVGERGLKLSGGERQRVALARAFLADAPILVLDEATSSLDSESEALIQDAMERLMRGRTTLVIAHRLATVRRLDRILVFDRGRVVEEGSHAQLLRREKGLYRRLFESQALSLTEGLESG